MLRPKSRENEDEGSGPNRENVSTSFHTPTKSVRKSDPQDNDMDANR